MAKKKQKTASGMPPDIDISTIVKQVRLRDLRLVKCLAALNGPWDNLPDNLQQTINVQCVADKGEKCIKAIITFLLSAEVTDADESTRDDPIQIQAAFAVVYDIDSFVGISQDQVMAFGQQNGVFNTWPYWREFVQSMTSRLGLPALRVPLLKGLVFKSDTPKKTTKKKAPKTAKRKKKTK